jgi:hypothetical protein
MEKRGGGGEQWRPDKYKGIKKEKNLKGLEKDAENKQTNKSQKDASLDPGQIYERTLLSAE